MENKWEYNYENLHTDRPGDTSTYSTDAACGYPPVLPAARPAAAPAAPQALRTANPPLRLLPSLPGTKTTAARNG